MNAHPLVEEVRQAQAKKQVDKFRVGDTVRVHFRIVEGEKERIQVFEGVVISRKGAESPDARFTVRRVAFGEGVERVFPLHSPRVERVEVAREAQVRRAKLYYLRERSGKSARVKARIRSASEIAAQRERRREEAAAKRAAKAAAAAPPEEAPVQSVEAPVEAPAEAPVDDKSSQE